MKTNFESENLNLMLWRRVYQTYTRFKNCLDRIAQKQGLTMENYLILVTIQFHDKPARITDIAQWLERSTNSVSMIVDRMVKAGLLRRARDRSDRRVVNVSITSKGYKAFGPANIAVREFMQRIMSPLSYEDRHTFVNLFNTLNYQLLEYLNPGADTEGMLKTDSERHEDFMKHWLKQALPAIPEAKRQGGEKGKTKKKTK